MKGLDVFRCQCHGLLQPFGYLRGSLVDDLGADCQRLLVGKVELATVGQHGLVSLAVDIVEHLLDRVHQLALFDHRPLSQLLPFGLRRVGCCFHHFIFLAFSSHLSLNHLLNGDNQNAFGAVTLQLIDDIPEVVVTDH